MFSCGLPSYILSFEGLETHSRIESSESQQAASYQTSKELINFQYCGEPKITSRYFQAPDYSKKVIAGPGIQVERRTKYTTENAAIQF
jgi:hypothetical protein